ncbi:hypothetical protein EYC80_005400 [Monilinia laxa]|uniref:Uncharacterized protein n=1 Tax=Monilinia laxa TaxID=61186 RepID=A0A5N6KK40_MONLA|nr:hypothetical protein EYC80_005400 [Monilinia laxa]
MDRRRFSKNGFNHPSIQMMLCNGPRIFEFRCDVLLYDWFSLFMHGLMDRGLEWLWLGLLVNLGLGFTIRN